MKNIHKGSWLNKVISHGKWYMLSSLVTKGMGFFLLPLYTTYLGTEGYGQLTSFNSITQFLPIIMSFYLDTAFGRFFHDYKEDPEKLKKLFSTVYWFVLLWGSFIFLCLLGSGGVWFPEFFKMDYMPAGLMVFVIPLLTQLALLGSVFLRQSLESRVIVGLELSTVLIGAGVSVLLIVSFDLGVTGRLTGMLCSYGFLFLFYTIYFVRRGVLGFIFDKNMLKKCLIYSIPLIPNIAGNVIAGLLDKFIIAKNTGIDDVGIYGFAFQIAIILYVIQDAITQVLGPVSMSGLVKEKEATLKKMASQSLFLWALMLTCSYGSFLFSKEFVFILGKDQFSGAYLLIPVVGFIYVLSAQYRIFSCVISFHHKNWVISSAGILSASLNLVLNIIFIPRYGSVAAAVTTLISSLFYTSWIIAWAGRWEKLGIKVKESLTLFISYMIFLGLGYSQVLDELSPSGFAVKVLLFFACLLVNVLIADKKLIRKGGEVVLSRLNGSRSRRVQRARAPESCDNRRER